MFIDTHCHLQFEQFNDDRAMVIGNAKKAGVKKFIVPGVDAKSNVLSIELSQKYPEIVFSSIGFHPYEASHNPQINSLQKMLITSSTLNSNPSTLNSIVAIGEIGLDYHLFKGEDALGKKQEQKMLFDTQLRLALSYKLPVIMHCRDAYDDFFHVLDSLPHMPRGVIHCFSGGLQEIRMASERKLCIGIDGNSTYAKQLQMIIPSIPLSIMLLETDSPYLTPIPYRGKRNEPKYIPLIAKCIAGLHQIPVSDVERQTSENASTLFGIS